MSEAELQTQIADYFRLVLAPDVFWFHPVNEGRRGWQAQRDFKAFGGRKGLPDLCLIHQGRALFIELKVGRNKLSPAQVEAHQAINRAGGFVTVIRSFDEMRETLKVWQVPTREAA